MRIRAYCRKCKRKHTRGTDIYRKHYAHLVDFREGNPVSNLYESFHGVAPIRKRKVYYEAPPKELIIIGELRRIDYQPVRGKHCKTQFFHESGDLGEKKVSTNLILATDKSGRWLYLVKKNKNSKYPIFSERGILG